MDQIKKKGFTMKTIYQTDIYFQEFKKKIQKIVVDESEISYTTKWGGGSN